MKIKTADLIDTKLDWAVAKALDRFRSDILHKRADGLYAEGILPDGVLSCPESVFDIPLKCLNYSDDWSQGGPIIEREKIAVEWRRQSFGDGVPHWYACHPKNEGGLIRYTGYGPTPLIAAMRCFVASKLGDEV